MYEHSAGCITFKLTERGPVYALILDRFGQWSFPKGHLEAGETAFAAARRELEEEVGLAEVELVTVLGESHHVFFKNSQKIKKRTEWFLVKATPAAELQMADAAHVKGVEWLGCKEAFARVGYTDLQPLLMLANKIVTACCT